MRSTKRWVVALALGCGLIGLALKAPDLFGPYEAPPPVAANHTAADTREPPRVPDAARDPEQVAPAAGGGPARAPEAGARPPAEPLDTVHALVDPPKPRSKVGSAAAKNRRSAIAAGPRARRRSTPLAARGIEVDRRGTPAGSGAILAGARPGERAPAPPMPDAEEVVFDSGDASYRTDAQLAVADLTGVRAGTISFWLQPQWSPGNQDDAAFIQLGDSLQVVKNVTFLRFEALEDGQVSSGVGVPIAAWKDGEWHQVTATWQDTMLTLYVDGQLVSRQQRVPPIQLADDAQMLVGSSYPPSRPVAPGVIGQVGFESRPLSPSEVQARFLKTLGQ